MTAMNCWPIPQEHLPTAPRNAHGVIITPTIQFGRWIDETANTLVTEAGLTGLEDCRWVFKPWYDRMSDDDTDDGVEHPRPVRLTAAEAYRELTVDGQPALSVRFPDLAPKFAPEYNDHSAKSVNVYGCKATAAMTDSPGLAAEL